MNIRRARCGRALAPPLKALGAHVIVWVQPELLPRHDGAPPRREHIPRVDAAAGIEPWLVGHATELAGAGIDPRELRATTGAAGNVPRVRGEAMIAE